MAKMTVRADSEIEIEGIDFKIDTDGTLWVDGGEFDDSIIRDIDELATEDEAEVEITDADLKKAREYLDQVQGEHEADFVDEALGQPGTSPASHSWMWSNLDDLGDYTDDMIEAGVKQQAESAFNYRIKDAFSDKYGVDMRMTFDEFLTASDYRAAIRDMEAARDEARLQQVMTTSEVVDEFGVDESTVRKAAGWGHITARQSGSTWLVLRKEVAARWGNPAMLAILMLIVSTIFLSL